MVVLSSTAEVGVNVEVKEIEGMDVNEGEREGEGEGDRDEKRELEIGDTNEEMAPIEDDKIGDILVVAITFVGKEEEANKEVLKKKDEVDSIGDEDIVIREDTTEVVNIDKDDEKLSIEDTSLLLGTGVVTVVVTIGISIELFDTVINDEVLKPFLMEKRKTSYKTP